MNSKTPTTRSRTPESPAPTLAELAEGFARHLEQTGKSPGTCTSYRAALMFTAKHLGPETRLDTLDASQVAAFFESDVVTKLRSGRPKAPSGVEKTRRVVRQALAWAAEQKLINVAPIPEPAVQA